MKPNKLYTLFRDQLDWIISQTPGESQTSVSRFLGMNDDYINHVRNDHNEISVRRLLQIAQYLNTEPQLFFQHTMDTRDRLLTDMLYDLRKLPPEELKALRDYIRIRAKTGE